MAIQITPQSVIPGYWREIEVTTDDELAFYGRPFLEWLIQYWRGEERFAVGSIKRLQKEIDQSLIETPQESIAKLGRKRETAKLYKEGAASKVRYLLTVIKRSERKPFLSHYRPLDWFNVGDEVMCFVNFEGATVNGFVPAVVVEGHRHQDGFVTVLTDVPVHNNLDNADGRGLTYGFERPEVMHKWEYEYFKAHPDFLKAWLRAASQRLAQGFGPAAFAAVI